MPHIHWVTRQKKLEIPIDKDEGNKREIRECDGRAHDPDTMVAPLTPGGSRKEMVAPLARWVANFRKKKNDYPTTGVRIFCSCAGPGKS